MKRYLIFPALFLTVAFLGCGSTVVDGGPPASAPTPGIVVDVDTSRTPDLDPTTDRDVDVDVNLPGNDGR